MMSAQISRHSNLFAYKYLEGMQSKPNQQYRLDKASFNQVKEIVLKEYQRLEAFSNTDAFRFMVLSQLVSNKYPDFKREFINYHGLKNQTEEEEGPKEDGIFVSAYATDQQIIGSAMSRLNGRFPTLAYPQKKSGNSIWRSSELSEKSM